MQAAQQAVRAAWRVSGGKPEAQAAERSQRVVAAGPPSPPAMRRRAWDALRSTSRARCLVLFHRGRCLMQVGVAPVGQAPGAAAPGPICQQAMKSGTGNYLANLVLFPGGWGAGGWGWVGMGAGAGTLQDSLRPWEGCYHTRHCCHTRHCRRMGHASLPPHAWNGASHRARRPHLLAPPHPQAAWSLPPTSPPTARRR